jgi:hypothetical protein
MDSSVLSDMIFANSSSMVQSRTSGQMRAIPVEYIHPS